MKTRGKSILLSFCCLLLVIAVAGCQNASPSATNNPTSDAQDKVISSDEKKLDEQVFPKDKVVDVKITLDPDDFQDMLDNASAEEYKMASVEYNGMKYDNVAVRTKGNLSLRSVVQMTDSDRYSFKISFDEYVNQNLFGITKINLNNNYSDASYMREFLTYELAESVGLPTPKYSFVNVYVNDELKGFYLAVEQIGDAYLERNFGNTYGALYKGVMTGQGSDLTWLGDDPALYTGLEMKSDKSNDDILVDMLNELNNGTDYEKYIDVEESLKYIALNAVTGNMDSYLGGNKQNYYLYEDDGVFSILPWDYNMAFGGMGSADVLIDEPTQGALAERPLIAKLLANEEYKTKYHEIVSEMITGYLADDTFQARIDELNTMISSYVKADPSAFYTFEQYENGIKAVETFMSNMVKVSSSSSTAPFLHPVTDQEVVAAWVVAWAAVALVAALKMVQLKALRVLGIPQVRMALLVILAQTQLHQIPEGRRLRVDRLLRVVQVVSLVPWADRLSLMPAMVLAVTHKQLRVGRLHKQGKLLKTDKPTPTGKLLKVDKPTLMGKLLKVDLTAARVVSLVLWADPLSLKAAEMGLAVAAWAAVDLVAVCLVVWAVATLVVLVLCSKKAARVKPSQLASPSFS